MFRYNKLVEPVLWERIELHRHSFHEHYALKPLRHEEAAMQRPYQMPKNVSDWDRLTGGDPYGDEDINRLEGDQDPKTWAFLDVFSTKKTAAERKRAHRLAGLIRWLCLPINGPYTASSDKSGRDVKKNDPWTALATLRNLEHLEISAYFRQPEHVEPFQASDKPLENLKTLKLRGYVPAEFVRFACANGSRITHLQLAALDVSSLSEDMGVRSDLDDYYLVAPKPLACLSPQTISSFTSLENVYLCKPSEVLINEYLASAIRSSIDSDKRALREWAYLLKSTRKTISCVTFDQRLLAECEEQDGMDNETYVEGYCNGPGYDRFVEFVLPVMLEEAEWPALKEIRLFGFEAQHHRLVHSVDLVGQLKARFGDAVQVRNGRGRWMVMSNEFESGELQEGGDVLDTTGSDWDYAEEKLPPWEYLGPRV
jgi:hypothetical protein